MQKKHFWLSLIILALLGSCGNVEDEYCRRPCHVVIDNAVHMDATLASAMNAMSPGIFCEIREVNIGGARHYAFSSNYGMTSTSVLNAIDLRISRIYGLNDGVIVGFGSLDNPAVFYAYDRECPNCFDPDAIPVKTRPLKMSERGWATCAVCRRSYDMNNRGYVVEGDAGKPLTRFPGRTMGPYGQLSVF